VARQSLDEEAEAVEHGGETTAGDTECREQEADPIPIEPKIDRNKSSPGRFHGHSFVAHTGSDAASGHKTDALSPDFRHKASTILPQLAAPADTTLKKLARWMTRIAPHCV
jgi:hypothetical protein